MLAFISMTHVSYAAAFKRRFLTNGERENKEKFLRRLKGKQEPRGSKDATTSSSLIVLSFHFRLRWTDRPTDRRFDVIFELSLTVSWCMSNFVYIGTSERTYFVVRK